MKSTPNAAEELWREEIEFARSMTPEQRLNAAGELFDEICERITAGIRHQFPRASAAEVKQILFERVELSRRLEGRE